MNSFKVVLSHNSVGLDDKSIPSMVIEHVESRNFQLGICSLGRGDGGKYGKMHSLRVACGEGSRV